MSQETPRWSRNGPQSLESLLWMGPGGRPGSGAPCSPPKGKDLQKARNTRPSPPPPNSF